MWYHRNNHPRHPSIAPSPLSSNVMFFTRSQAVRHSTRIDKRHSLQSIFPLRHRNAFDIHLDNGRVGIALLRRYLLSFVPYIDDENCEPCVWMALRHNRLMVTLHAEEAHTSAPHTPYTHMPFPNHRLPSPPTSLLTCSANRSEKSYSSSAPSATIIPVYTPF